MKLAKKVFFVCLTNMHMVENPVGRVAKIFIFAKIPGGGGVEAFWAKSRGVLHHFGFYCIFAKMNFPEGNLFHPPSPLLTVCIYAVNQF
jgi:hypothetical protein